MEQVSNASIDGNSTLEQIAQALSDKKNEKRQFIVNKGVVCQELYSVVKDMSQLQKDMRLKKDEKDDLEESKRKAQEALNLINNELSVLTSMFWDKKNI